LWEFSFVILKLIIRNFLDGTRIVLAVDDTTCLHKGKKVFGRAKHRDGVRSSHGTLIPLMGHKWVVISVVVKLKKSHRHWALPVAVGLCRSSEFASVNNKRHKTPAHIARLLVARIQRKFKKYSFIIVGDQGYGQHATACAFSSATLTLVSKFYPDAVLHSEVKQRVSPKPGPKPQKGSRLPSPSDVVGGTSKFTKTTVSWYGGLSRNVEYATGTGYWYRSSHGVVEIKWVFVRDLTGTHRDEYLYTTDTTMSPENIISLYTSRWAIEVTFQECKGHLRLEKTCVWSEASVLTLVPLLFGCYSAIVLMGSQQASSMKIWPGKINITFSDMLLTLRRNTWKNLIFKDTEVPQGLCGIEVGFKRQLLDALCQTAA
jgi:hypothetical protein